MSERSPRVLLDRQRSILAGIAEAHPFESGSWETPVTAGGGANVLAKVMAVHRRRGLALVAPWIAAVFDAATDPSIEANWDNADNFALEESWLVVWIGGYTGVQVGWPCMIVTLNSVAGAALRTIMPFVQVHGTPPEDEVTEDYGWRFWEPDEGTMGPEDLHTNTLPLDDAGILDVFDDQYPPEE